MHIYDLIQQWVPEFSSNETKIHLARWNGSEHPIDVFISGKFDGWQAWQSKKNFERKYVLSLIDAGHGKWLYAGLFLSKGAKAENSPKGNFTYKLERVPAAEEFVGRLYVRSSYKGRTSYLNALTLADDLTILELLPERVSYGVFPGYKNVNLRREQLDIVIAQGIDSWKTALSNVKGIYLITDRTNGKLYVGKADGAQGFWQRWSDYATSGHGGNRGLIDELKLSPPERKCVFR
jgi:hypothetical protein